jgi:hypothetical protein
LTALERLFIITLEIGGVPARTPQEQEIEQGGVPSLGPAALLIIKLA